MRLWKTIFFWSVFGLLAGLVWGAGQALTLLRAHQYLDHGMHWLAVDTVARNLDQGAI